ncbi:LysR family transcriptional regulator [Gilvimarinus xylanilyticus]|uniref:LysR family transcriptional regulator n=1 Tax=Gilvimarinus xylanilyticus TaxID=2944139 RepID=A0A9X2HWB2_9GAMM|nr:LysR family transcriptional regulator [Gilvimarinus xylanilyticus]MCP8898864.1 LysR family transcriptional regulator [Gilvimarinus xylanilyticus]
MDSQQLLTFIAVAESGSFSAASARLHLTQPAISKRIAALEQNVGEQLFDRVGKQIQLSQAGKVLLPHARTIAQNLQAAERALADLTGTVGGTLSIATSHHIGLHRLPPVLSDFSREHPDVVLDLHFLDSEKAMQAVLQGEFDLGVITLPDTLPRQIDSAPIWHDDLCFAVAENHPLAGRRVQLASLTEFQAILPDSSTYTTQRVQQLFDRSRLPLKIHMVTNHLDTIKMMVSIGLGWGVLPRQMLDPDLREVFTQVKPMHRELGAVTHRDRSLSNAGRIFLQLLKSHSQHQRR